MNEKRYLWLDLVRGISALLVLADHLRSVFFGQVNFGNDVGFQTQIFFFLTSLGHQSVMIFFVMSGFFVGGSILRNKNAFSWSSYLLARLCRLWVVLIPALLFTTLNDTIIAHTNPEVLSGSLTEIWGCGPSPESPWTSSLSTFTGNLFFLQRIVVPIHGSNGPLWSLANEFWYYIMFPLGAVALGWVKSPTLRSRVICSILLLISLTVFRDNILRSMLIWLAGVIVFVTVPNRLGCGNMAAFGSILMFFGSLMLSKLGVIPTFLCDLIIGGCFSLAMKFFFLVKAFPDFRWFKKLSIFLSDISYSLYLIHFPLVILIASYLYRGKQHDVAPISIGIYFAWFLALVAVGGGFWWMFERHTNIVRKFIISRFMTRWTQVRKVR